jgi:hypothetical protein
LSARSLRSLVSIPARRLNGRRGKSDNPRVKDFWKLKVWGGASAHPAYLRGHQRIPARRALRADEPAPPFLRLDPGQHRRGLREERRRGTGPLHAHLDGLSQRAGVPSVPGPRPRLPHPQQHRGLTHETQELKRMLSTFVNKLRQSTNRNADKPPGETRGLPTSYRRERAENVRVARIPISGPLAYFPDPTTSPPPGRWRVRPDRGTIVGRRQEPRVASISCGASPEAGGSPAGGRRRVATRRGGNAA